MSSAWNDLQSHEHSSVIIGFHAFFENAISRSKYDVPIIFINTQSCSDDCFFNNQFATDCFWRHRKILARMPRRSIRTKNQAIILESLDF